MPRAKSQVDDGRAPKRRRNRQHFSCENCRARKMKCSKSYPCSSCRMRGENCVWKGAAPSTTDNDELEEAHSEIQRLRQLVNLLTQALKERDPSSASSLPGFDLAIGHEHLDDHSGATPYSEDSLGSGSSGSLEGSSDLVSPSDSTEWPSFHAFATPEVAEVKPSAMSARPTTSQQPPSAAHHQLDQGLPSQSAAGRPQHAHHSSLPSVPLYQPQQPGSSASASALPVLQGQAVQLQSLSSPALQAPALRRSISTPSYVVPVMHTQVAQGHTSRNGDAMLAPTPQPYSPATFYASLYASSSTGGGEQRVIHFEQQAAETGYHWRA